MKAYMSDAGGPQAGDASDIRLDAFDADKGASAFEYYPQWCSRTALREAERILAETEADAPWTVHERINRAITAVDAGYADLAADLAAILPVLDELEQEARNA